MKSLTILASVALFSFEMAAQQTIDITTGDVVDLATSTAPTRLVENLDNGVRVTYTFDYARLDSVSSDSGNGAFIVSFNGFGLCEIPGRPALPSKLDAIEVPSAEDAVLTVETIDYSDYFFEIAPAVSPEPESSPVKTIASVAPISIPNGFYPAQQVEIVGSQNYYEKVICYFSVTPVAYDHVTKSVRIANKIVYTVSFGEAYASGREPRKVCSATDDAVSVDPVYGNVVLNAQSSSGQEFGEVIQDYLILTTPECESAVNKFADWKRALGFRTHVCVSDNLKTDSIVRRTINSYTDKYDIKYLLIVGNASDIAPTKRVYKLDSMSCDYVTDYYYSSKGKDTSFKNRIFPEIYVGRIPASTNIEAKNAFDKIIAYEKCEKFDYDFFNRGLHCAFFENYDYSIYDGKRFVCTSEEVLATARDNGVNPTRIYTAGFFDKDIRPRYYSENELFETNGQLLPCELVDPDFNWYNCNQDIKNVLESKVPYVLYRGHGVSTGYITPLYTSSDILQEHYDVTYLSMPHRNPMIYPVFFNITCLTGRYNEVDCFATTSIVSKDKGSSCIIAASDDGYSGYDDALALGLFDAFYPIPIKTTYITLRTENQQPVYRIGQILGHGLFRMIEKMGMTNPLTRYTQEIFHCFGDPSMTMWCNKPTKFDNAKIKLDLNTLICNVTTGEEPAYISFYDKNINEVKCFYGTEASFRFAQIHIQDENHLRPSPYEYVVISAPNKIPIVKFNWVDAVAKKIENVLLNEFRNVFISYSCDQNDDVGFVVTSVSTGKSRIVDQPKGETEAVIDLSDEAPGSYVVTLVVNGNNVDSSTILIN